MQKTCIQCSAEFTVTNEDLAFYKKVSPIFNGKTYDIPPPTHCPECRSQRRHARFNYEYLYKRKDNNGKEIISVLSEDKPYTVYSSDIWFGDSWDAMDYGKNYDFNKPFFEQMNELSLKVPVISLFVLDNENSNYVQYSGWNKNCYLCFCTDYCEDCLYTHSVYHSKNSLDCFFSYMLELCYECVYCDECYRIFYSQNCQHCNDSAFLFDCQNCHDCFGCVGLRGKEYCFFNEQLT